MAGLSSSVEAGQLLTEWAEARMPVLTASAQAFAKTDTFSGLRCAIAVHITSETAALARALAAAGTASVVVCSSNPRTANAAVMASLEHDGIEVVNRESIGIEEHAQNFRSVLRTRPDVIIDDGAELIRLLHVDEQFRQLDIIGALEETTSGVRRICALSEEGTLRFPVVNINGAATKHLFDNRYGTGQSALDSIMRSTNTLIAGSRVLVIGYGMCGKGIARAARGLGAQVLVSEIDPIAALEAHLDGHAVLPALDGCAVADIVITATGSRNVIRGDHWKALLRGSLVVNCGHFRNELDMAGLQELCPNEPAVVRRNVYRYDAGSSGHVLVLSDGDIGNLAAAEGNPAALMDMSFSDQLRGLAWLIENRDRLGPEVVALPAEIDVSVARDKLSALSVRIDTQHEDQVEFDRSHA
ncbi:adenosylhomocysteinase [Nocardia ninae]|uniref:Adenosylhomocysteinase n=1 Tax=Nocardia ninae NBRC 108245 TaxID=1210091 RepID=A0A511MLW2_9NOCA|nr:adenosylhomocysteinase [Nocardia ninae]GEM41609.1 adenosylhomocysteinase [Nocardia ninae NBRC 108245]